jgi:hypothetical protein
MVLAIALVVLCADATAAVWYVDKDNTGPENGTAWATAFNTIQEGIDAAYAAGGGEVWVAEGVYNEARSSDPHGTGVNTGSVLMKEGVHLYGGFAGNESDRDQRDWAGHATTVDGSTSRAGARAYHVIVGTDSSTLDGLTVLGGDANGATTAVQRGGGMYNYQCSPVIANCVFRSNHSEGGGGGMFNGGANCLPTISIHNVIIFAE